MNSSSRRAPASSVAAAVALLSLGASGCARFSKDGGFDPVAEQTRARLGKEVRWARTDQERSKSNSEVAQLLARPLSVEDAVQIALLNNPRLQASFEDLGISEADLVQSGRLPNPRFTLRHAGAGGQYDIEESLTFNVLSLLTAPYAHRMEKQRFAQTQSSVLLAIVQCAEDTRRAYWEALAARASVHYAEQVEAAAETGAELARRMVAAGHWNSLDQARERAFHIEAAQALRRAGSAEVAARERLTRLLALTPQQPPLQLAARLPELPPALDALPDIEGTVLLHRVDLILMRQQVDALARRLGLTRATRFLSVLDAGPTRVRQGTRSTPYENGYELSLEIPLFDSGAARVKKAEAQYAQAVGRFTQAVIDARSQIRQADAQYRMAFDLAAQQRDEALPTRQLIAAQNLLRYNASQLSVFDLLTDARERAVGIDAYIRSVRDFWMARSDLDAALLGNFSFQGRESSW